MTDKFNIYHQFAKTIRKSAIDMVYEAKSSHIGGALSIADILAVLYNGILRFNPENPGWKERDRFILSKGHTCSILYATLAEKGFFPKEWLKSYCKNDGRLAGHVTHTGVPGIEISTGSLGHGLSVACGMALAGKRDKKDYRVFVVLGDGECNEGSIWEAVLFASQNKLDNLVVIVDYNGLQGMGNAKDILNLEPFIKKWEVFGWAAAEIDGHNFNEIDKALTSVPFYTDKPYCIIANTVKGKGVSFMENELLWHYRSPSEEEYKQAIGEIEAS